MTDADDSASIQRAIDAGAETIYLPTIGGFGIGEPVIIRGKLKALVGFQAQLSTLQSESPNFIIDESFAGPLLIQDLIDVGKIENRSGAALVILKVQGIDAVLSGQGTVDFENVVGTLQLKNQQQVMARHFNSEPLGTKVENEGGEFVVVGFKTERGGTLVQTTEQGRSQVMGGLCYTTNRGDLAPMFVNRDSSVWAAIGEVCYTGDPFQTLVLEQRGTQSREWTRREVPRRFDFLQGSALLYDGRR